MRVVSRSAAIAVLAAALVAAAGCSPSSSGFDTAAHAPYPRIPTGGGPILASAGVVTVYFAGDPNAPALSAFVDWLAQSDWLARVAGEYGVQGVRHLAHVSLGDAAPAVTSDADVAALLGARIADGTLPSAASPAAPVVYALLLPGGTLATHLGGRACAANPGNGYHDTVTAGGAEVPVVVLPACDPRFTAILTPVQSMELDVARLLVDTLTDASPRNEPGYALLDASNAWTALGAELGDFCWGRLLQGGAGHTLQRVWSNATAAAGGDPCVPAVPGSTAFGATASPTDLAVLSVGVPSVFHVTGWSLGPVAAWNLQVTPWTGDYPIAATLDRDSLQNGEVATLTVTVPYAVPAGSYGAVRLQSANALDATSWPVAFLVRPAP